MTKLKGVIVGSGYVSSFHLRAWARIKGVSISAIASLDAATAGKRAAEFGIPAVYTSVEEMISGEQPDFIDIATPPESHPDLVHLSAAHGAHVLCQKPAAQSLTDLREMDKVCRDNGVVLAINENCRFQPWYRRVHDLAWDQQRIGRIYKARVEARTRLTMSPTTMHGQDYFARMPRLAIYEFGVHHLDTIRYLLGEADTVYAATQRISPLVTGEDVATVITKHGDAVATLDISWVSEPASAPRVKETWGTLVLEGEQGTILVDYDGIVRLQTGGQAKVETMPDNGVDSGFQAMQQQFINCVLTGEEPETSGAETHKTMELVFGAYHSAANDSVYVVGDHVHLLD